MLKNVKEPRGDIGPAGVSPWPRPPPKSPPGPAYILLRYVTPPAAGLFRGVGSSVLGYPLYEVSDGLFGAGMGLFLGAGCGAAGCRRR